MRVNVYSQELTDEVNLTTKDGEDGETYSAVMFMLHSSGQLHHPPMDDDRSAVTFWLPASQARRETLAKAFEEAARLVRVAGPEVCTSCFGRGPIGGGICGGCG
ncbi:hypothetical protein PAPPERLAPAPP_03430 [Brevundimonas phage vB_BpoS-Papperlapapp]|uniref:Uncharacterized protein n=1 Tax=Brevundimonas phage vB_BpoS-Domovoi TaxID=2948598 RepID=A0A9E7SMC8_9CAUD|nr:hypothetical protein DOMOVOI_02380 [Brevundimonas phage vB_BpoS-Domovoi]USN16084.1 hypothetical protein PAPPERLAPAPP_03430 [Brevundimonas phage vB_BpoS-Papperlapapp]